MTKTTKTKVIWSCSCNAVKVLQTRGSIGAQVWAKGKLVSFLPKQDALEMAKTIATGCLVIRLGK